MKTGYMKTGYTKAGYIKTGYKKTGYMKAGYMKKIDIEKGYMKTGYRLVKASVEHKVPDPSGQLYIEVVKSLFSLRHVLVSLFYTPYHEHSNALLIAVKGPTVDFFPAETLGTLVGGPGPLTDLDDVGEDVRGIV